MIVDFHNHYYPAAYLDAVKAGGMKVRMDYDADGNPRLHYPGDYNILVPGHRDLDVRERVLDELGVTHQILSFTTPGVHYEEPANAVRLARVVNDAYASDVSRRKHFSALATLPLNDPAASVAELQRAVRELGFRGAMVFSNVNGTGLNHVSYMKLWEKADELEAIIYIHPAHPLGVEAMEEVLADAAGGVSHGHHAGRRKAGVQRDCRAFSPDHVGADAHGRRRSLPGGAHGSGL